MGEAVKPHLKSWYMAAKFDHRMSGMEGLSGASEEGLLYSRASTTPWPADFPKAFSHTTVGKVTDHPDHKAAKAGDEAAARRLVADLLKPERIAELAKRFPGAIVVPVVEQEKTGINMIPAAIAERLQLAGFRMADHIYQVGTAKRSGLDAAQRLISRKEFQGDIVAGEKYLLVDDILTQGGTIHELRHHIANNGGEAVGVISLAFSAGSNVISIQQQTITQLAGRFGRGKLEKILDEYNIAGTIEALTESEGNAILRFKSLDSLRNRLNEAQDALLSQDDSGAQPLRSVREALTSGQTPADTRAELSEKIGNTAKLEESGKLNIVRTMAGLPEKIRNGLAKYAIYSTDGKTIVGAYADGKVWLVSDAIKPGEAFGVLAHEAGHAILAEDAKYQELKPKFIADFKRLEKFGSTKAKAARAMVPADTGLRPGEVYKDLKGDRKAEVDAVRDEEALAYFIQQEANKQQPLHKRIISAIKMALMRWGMPVGRLTESDLVNIFVAGARQWAREGAAQESFAGNPMVAFSKQFGITVEEAQRQYDAVVAKHKGTTQWMKAPNGEPTKLNERQWVQTRTEAFKEWFGDWEKASQYKRVMSAAQIDIADNDVSEEKARRVYEGLSSATNKDDGRRIIFVNSIFGKLARHKQKEQLFRIVSQLPDMVASGIPMFSEDERNPQKHINIVGYSNYVSRLRMDGKDYFARLTVQEVKKPDGNELHNVYVSDVEIIEAGSLDNPSGLIAPNGAPTIRQATSLDKILSSWLADVKVASESASKVVDENGEPLVVYHGTPGKFNVFAGRHKNMAQFPAEVGASFFTPDKEMARGYAGGETEPMAVFLNLSNPGEHNANGGWWISANFKAIRPARENGADGVIIRNVVDTSAGQSQRPIDTYITFSPNRIKSAAGNTGQFSPHTGDIRHSVREAAKATLDNTPNKNDNTENNITRQEVGKYERRSETLTKSQQESHERAEREATGYLRGLPGAVLGNRIAKSFKDQSKVSLLGQKIESLDDLAIIGQIFRNPSFETNRYVFVKDGRRMVARPSIPQFRLNNSRGPIRAALTIGVEKIRLTNSLFPFTDHSLLLRRQFTQPVQPEGLAEEMGHQRLPCKLRKWNPGLIGQLLKIIFQSLRKMQLERNNVFPQAWNTLFRPGSRIHYLGTALSRGQWW